jgi:CRISPR-associated protein Cas1
MDLGGRLMAVAYVVEQNASINREGERLLIKKGTSILHALHLFKLDQLVLMGNVFLTPQAIATLLHHGIDTVFMSRSGRYRGRLQPLQSKNITLRCEQFGRMAKEELRLDTARRIIEGKLANQRAMLLRLNRSREGLGLDDSILEMKRLGRQAAEASSPDALRGYEGRGAVVYFDGFARGFLADGVAFRKRVRRPPTDPVNALLSLGYTLLFNTVMAAVSLVGFDPYLGCFHVVDYGRPSLALDLMEEWRPVIVDSLVLSVFNLKTLTPADFIQTPGPEEEIEDDGDSDLTDAFGDKESETRENPSALPVRLTDDGFKKFIAQFERKMAEKVRFPLTEQQFSYRDCIREQVRHFARLVRGEEKTYRAYFWK